ncbi:MAG: FAD-dependent oxidoreductase [archaeon]
MKNVAIIGSGPAGLAAAEYLAKEEFGVTIFDELKEFGGMIAYGIPEFRIPLKSSRERKAQMEKKGIIFENKKILSVKSLLKNFGGEFDYVILAIGAGAGSSAGFEGKNDPSIIDALNLLTESKLYEKNLLSKEERVIVIGGGNSAVDAARAAVRQCEKVTIIYRRTRAEMPALKNEVDSAEKEGVQMDFLLAPKKLVNANGKKELVCSEMILGEKDASGRRKPIDSGKTRLVPCDKIIVAIGQTQDLSWLKKEGIKCADNLVQVDGNYKTTLEGVYAAGDCVTGAKTIGEATKTGLLAAKAILQSAKN